MDTLAEHEPGLPDKPLRDHCLRVAMEAAEATLRAHGYYHPERSLEVLHVALEEALAEDEELVH